MAAPQGQLALHSVEKALPDRRTLPELPLACTSEPLETRHIGQFRRGWPLGPSLPHPKFPTDPCACGLGFSQLAPALNEVSSKMRCPFFGFHGDRPLSEGVWLALLKTCGGCTAQ